MSNTLQTILDNIEAEAQAMSLAAIRAADLFERADDLAANLRRHGVSEAGATRERPVFCATGNRPGTQTTEIEIEPDIIMWVHNDPIQLAEPTMQEAA